MKNIFESYNFFAANILLFLSIICVSSCKTTKRLSKEEFLLREYKVVIVGNDHQINKSEIEALVKQKPNHRLLGIFPFHLQIYNLIDPKKEEIRDKKRLLKERDIYDKRREQAKRNNKPIKDVDRFYLSRWFMNIGEKPVIYSNFKTKDTEKQIRQYLKNKGFYYSIVSDSAYLDKQKAHVTYFIKPETPYRIDSVTYKIEDPLLVPIILMDRQNSFIKKNCHFDVDLMQNERQRITDKLKNMGYYNFTKEFIFYLADTSIGNYKVNLTLGLKKWLNPYDSTQTPLSHKKFRINHVNFFTDYDPKKALEFSDEYFQQFERKRYDSTNFFFFNTSRLTINPNAILRENYIYPGDLYKQSSVNQTYQQLSSLQAIKLVNVDFNESADNDTLLDCQVRLTPHTRQSYTAELEGSNSSGNWGLAGNLIYRHKNMFRGLEIFDLKLRGARETQTDILNLDKSGKNLLNTFEYGIESNISFPKFILPFSSEDFSRQYNLKTNFTFAYNYQNRPDYNRSIANLRFGYSWQGKKFWYVRHYINPLEINMVNVWGESENFKQSKELLLLQYSYTNQLIIASAYSVIFDNQNIKKRGSHIYFRANLESAGNILNLYSHLTSASKTDDSYELFNIKYAQYTKVDFDVRYYHLLRKEDNLVMRTFIGIAYPYGNSKYGLPFIKKYFSGGANSIRAWKVRSLGPGAYHDTIMDIMNQSADLKLEGNLEYRAKIFPLLEIATFIDAGNIWTIRDVDNRKDALFMFDNFYNQIAVGAGIGFRFDFSFFIFRFDFGFKMRDPTLSLGHRWLPFNHKYSREDWEFNFGIGYPF